MFIKILVFWNGRDGFQTLLNTDVFAELSHMASFLKMAVGKYYVVFCVTWKLLVMFVVCLTHFKTILHSN